MEHVSEKREDARRSERDLEQFLNAVSKYVQTEHLQKMTDANIGLLDDCESSVSDHTVRVSAGTETEIHCP